MALKEGARRRDVRTGRVATPSLDLGLDDRVYLAGIADQRMPRGQAGDLVIAIIRKLVGLVDDLQIE